MKFSLMPGRNLHNLTDTTDTTLFLKEVGTNCVQRGQLADNEPDPLQPHG
jgi:hypothetical protein